MLRDSIRHRLERLPEICASILPHIDDLEPSVANSCAVQKFKDILIGIKEEHRIEFLDLCWNLDANRLQLSSHLSSKIEHLLKSLPCKVAKSRMVKKIRDLLSNDDDDDETLRHTPIFALLIGIDKYQSDRWSNLRGGIADAKAMQEYLEEDLAIPRSQIRTLHGEKATRSAIIHELREIKNNPSIKPGDSILIFYAGHGDATAVPEGWDESSKEIQLLVPYDGDTEVNNEKIYSIPDRTIRALLEDVAQEKKDNITVILDCCHATSLTRGRKFWNTRTRGNRSGVKIPPNLDREIWGRTRGAKVAPNYERSGLSSHVVLTACGANEEAEENCEGGVFTQALLKKLRELRSSELTYHELIQHISLPRQNPQCEGRHRNRSCFSSRVLSQYITYPVRQVNDHYIMGAGTAHGITTGAIFAIYDDSIQALVKFKTSKLGLFTSKLTIAPNQSKLHLKDAAFAIQIKAGTASDLRVHYAQDKDLTRISQEVARKAGADGKSLYGVVAEEDRNSADLGVVMESNRISFDIIDKEAARFGVERMPETIPADPEELHRVLLAAGHYLWHYHRKPAKPQESPVTIEFTMLQETPGQIDGESTGILKPCSPNLINEQKVIELVSDEYNIYGIKVTNTGDVPLYISAFFFDHSNFAIHSCYQPPTGHDQVDPSLEPNRSLSIGYGSSGTEPYIYFASNKSNKEVGFLKFFISTEKLDLSGVAQPSPFSEEGKRLYASRGAVPRPQDGSKAHSFWYTETIPVVVRAQHPRFTQSCGREENLGEPSSPSRFTKPEPGSIPFPMPFRWSSPPSDYYLEPMFNDPRGGLPIVCSQ